MKRLFIATLLALCLPVTALAQEDDDRGRLTRLIESQLSDGAARQVRIDGFRGALSSEATLDRLTISDADGPWLILEGAVLDWRRTALLRGNLEVDALTAERLEIVRPPLPPEGPQLPSAEATPFSLPELPVSINIAALEVSRLELGPAFLGQEAVLSLSGQARLADGSGSAVVDLVRLEGPSGVFDLDVAFDNETRVLDLALLLDEAEGGLAATLLSVPDTPPLSLEVSGAGPLEDILLDLSLSTSGVERVTGTLHSEQMADDAGQSVEIDISGDLSPLLAAEYRPFFGQSSEVAARIERTSDGATSLNDMRLRTAALLLTGDVRLDPQNRPVTIDVVGRVSDPAGGGPVRLPVAGAPTFLSSADLNFDFDATQSDAFRLIANLNGLETGDLRMDVATVSADGRIVPSEAGIGAVAASLETILEGLTHSDPALAEALGSNLVLTTNVAWEDGAPLRLDELELVAGNLALEGAISAGLGEQALPVDYDLSARAENLARFSALSGQSLSGALVATLSGSAEALSGAFDVSLDGTASDLRIEPAVPAGLFPGDTRVRLDAARDGSGTRIDLLSLDGRQIDLEAQGAISSNGGTLSADARLADVSLFTTAVDGPAEARLSIDREGNEDWTIDADVSAAAGIRAQVDGTASPDGANVDVSARASLDDLGLFTSAIRGPARADVSLARQASEDWRIDANLTGPVGLQARVNGSVAADAATVDLGATGRAPLELANPFISPQSITGTAVFDLGLRGAPGLDAIGGTVSVSGARLALPTLETALENIGVNARVRGGAISLDASANVASGGRIGLTGSIDAGAPAIPATLDATLDSVRLVDPTLYELVVARGDLAVRGPLLRGPQISGRILLGDTNLRVPEAGLGPGAIPDIRHVQASSAELQTLAAAGLLEGSGNGGGSGGGAIGLDIEIEAPGRIFLRGRGIDAEFGGRITLGGTSENVIPSGQFDLVRGRISILGTRLDFIEGSAILQGDFDPFLRLRAESRAGEYRVIISVEGPASNPSIVLSSDPFLPEDEILAQLLFGRSVSALSPVQLLQLADAATQLAGGRSDGGILSNLREGLGLDDLDLQTNEQGNVAVRAGRYLSENIYTDVTIGAEGESALSLNIDLTPNVTARGSVSSDGGSALGVFFERDY